MRWVVTGVIAYAAIAMLRSATFAWIEGWYNPHRRHSSIGYRSPVNYERAHERSAA